MAAPPLSIAGVWQALRWPTARDMVFTLKAYLAVTLCLAFGFSQDLLNPYWSVLTVYIVLMQPESGAIRSKAFYRLIGTVGGGLLILALTGLIGDQLGILLAANIAVIVISAWARGVDRTPTNYIWFSTGLTAGFIGLVDLQTPENMFTYSTARIAEISVGILVMAAVDSVIWPKHMKPGFLSDMRDWRNDARDWIAEALGNVECHPPEPKRRKQVRERLRKLTGAIANLDAKAVQLPYDSVDSPPRRRDVHLGRLMVMRLIADLASIEEWTRALRRTEGAGERIKPLLDDVTDWVCNPPDDSDTTQIDREAGDALCRRIHDAESTIAARTDHAGLVEHGMIRRLDHLVGDWRDLDYAIEAIRTREKLPDRLRAIARGARPTRSVDYLANARDVLPMLVALIISSTIYYLTAWSSGSYAMLFSFIGCAFLGAQPETLRSGVGVVTWVCIAFAAVFAYKFAVLPRVTDFPLLIAVFGAYLIPVGLLLSMSFAGLFMAVFFFAFLSLQNTYSADFGQSLLSLGGALCGLGIAIACLYVLGYDKQHFTARRIVRAMRIDIADLATVARIPERKRFVELTVDRLSQFFPAIQGFDDDDPLVGIGLIDDMRIGLNILSLRELAPDLPPAMAQELRELLDALAHAYRKRRIGDRLPDSIRDRVDHLIDSARAIESVPLRGDMLVALVGIQMGLAFDDAMTQAPADKEAEPV